MSDAVNPYQSPETAAVPVRPLTDAGTLTETMLIYLKEASPWLRFVGILGFISSGLTVLWGTSFFAFIPLIRNAWDEVPGFEQFSAIMGAAFGGSMAVFSTGIGALCFFLSLFVYRFGEKIRIYLRTGMDQQLELAFKNNKSLWKLLGILCIIQLAFIPLAIIGGIVALVVIAVS